MPVNKLTTIQKRQKSNSTRQSLTNLRTTNLKTGKRRQHREIVLLSIQDSFMEYCSCYRARNMILATFFCAFVSDLSLGYYSDLCGTSIINKLQLDLLLYG